MSDDVKQLWEAAVDILERQVRTLDFDIWIKTLEPVSIEGEKLVLSTPTEMSRRRVETVFRDYIVKALKSSNLIISDFALVVSGEKREEEVKSEKPRSQVPEEQEMPERIEANVLKPGFTFDTFVVGRSNEVAYAAARSVAENPGENYNPLFIYGGVGLGKTHLMHAIGNELKRRSPKLKVLYIPTEKFVNEYVTSVRRGGESSDFGKQFHDKYRNLDVLMIDDIQFIAKRVETQNELFHTFNDLAQAGKQIVFTSDRPPKEIPDLEERLRSRFEWGLIVDIQQPDMETRMAILQKKALFQHTVLPQDVLTYMAQRSASNIREMESMLNKVIFLARLYNKPISVALAQETFKDYAEPTQESVAAEDVINCVCKYFNVTKDELLGKKKDKRVAEPRQICMYVISELLPLPQTAIGEMLGGRDRTTVLHAKNKVAQALEKGDDFTTRAVSDVKNMVYRK